MNVREAFENSKPGQNLSFHTVKDRNGKFERRTTYAVGSRDNSRIVVRQLGPAGLARRGVK